MNKIPYATCACPEERLCTVLNEVIKKQLRGISSELDIQKYRLQWINYLE
jgi:hypothetical protein